MVEHDLVGIFLTLLRQFGERVRAVRDDQWRLPTPAEGWDVAALVAHLIEELRWVEPLLSGLNIEAAATEVDASRGFAYEDATGTKYAQAWADAAGRAGKAFSEPDALARPVSLARGTTVAAGYISELIFELTVHSWDLGRAIMYPEPLPDAIVCAVWNETKRFSNLSASEMFDVPVPVRDDAPVLDRLIALTGRDPR